MLSDGDWLKDLLTDDEGDTEGLTDGLLDADAEKDRLSLMDGDTDAEPFPPWMMGSNLPVLVLRQNLPS